MPKSLQYRKLKALEDGRDLHPLQSVTRKLKKSFLNPEGLPATQPELRVFYYLVHLGVAFRFQSKLKDLWETAYPEDFTPDFYLPDYKTVIEVQGRYWHSRIENVNRDAYKATFYEMSAEVDKTVYWDEFEIYWNLDYLFSRDLPELFTAETKRGTVSEFTFSKEDKRAAKEATKAAFRARRIKPKRRPLRERVFKLKRRSYLRSLTPPRNPYKWKVKKYG